MKIHCDRPTTCTQLKVEFKPYPGAVLQVAWGTDSVVGRLNPDVGLKILELLTQTQRVASQKD